MDHHNSTKVLFEDQIRIDRIDPFNSFAEPGDSGSLVVSKSDHQAVGLYFAGPQDGKFEYGIANHIGDVLKELEIEILL